MREEKLSWETEEMVGHVCGLCSHRNRSTVEVFVARVAAAGTVGPSLRLKRLLLLLVTMANSRTESKAVRLIR